MLNCCSHTRYESRVVPSGFKKSHKPDNYAARNKQRDRSPDRDERDTRKTYRGSGNNNSNRGTIVNTSRSPGRGNGNRYVVDRYSEKTSSTGMSRVNREPNHSQQAASHHSSGYGPGQLQQQQGNSDTSGWLSSDMTSSATGWSTSGGPSGNKHWNTSFSNPMPTNYMPSGMSSMYSGGGGYSNNTGGNMSSIGADLYSMDNMSGGGQL